MFGLPDDYDNYGELFRILLSNLETRPASLALRFQALYSFHRSMVVAMALAAIIGVAGVILGHLNVIPLRSQLVALGTIAISGILTLVFYARREKFEKAFVRYVILDFYQDQVTRRNHQDPTR